MSGITYRENAEVSIKTGDNASSDAFGRYRVSELFGIMDNKNLSTANRGRWYEIITGAILVYSGLTGTFTNGEEVRGTLPTGGIAIGTIDTDNGADTMYIDCNHNTFQVGDTITGQTSGATATVVSANTGSDIQHDYDSASVTITAGTRATDRAYRQFGRPAPYVSGKSHLSLQTFVLGEPKTNAVRRVGYYDDDNGIFLEQTASDIAIVIRSSTSGSAVDRRIPQSEWNLDRLDGTGTSGITLDLTKSQIMSIDFQWLGVGRIRIGFVFDGKITYAHQDLNSNVRDGVYMRTPSLPVRFEVENTGATASPTSMSEICSSVSSEGGYSLPGLEFSSPQLWANERSVSSRTPIVAIRLKNNYPAGEPNRRVVKFIDIGAFVRTNDCLFEIVHIHDPYDITATWTDVGPGSAVEYSADITAVSGRPAHLVNQIIREAGGGTAKGSAAVITGTFINEHTFLAQNPASDNSEMFVVYATPRTGSSDVMAHLTWIEVE